MTDQAMPQQLSYEPYYQLVARWVRDEIISGRLPLDAQIPTEEALAKKFGVARMTARYAITELVQEGLVYRVQGRGTFVARNKVERHLNSLTGFFEDMQNMGLHPESKILELAERLPDVQEQRLLNIGKSERVYSVRRIRYLGELPIGVQHFVVPESLVPGFGDLDLTTTSFYGYLRDVGVQIASAHQVIEATMDPTTADLLGIPADTPFLRIQRVSFDTAEKAIELLHSWFRGDKYSYSLDLAQNVST